MENPLTEIPEGKIIDHVEVKCAKHGNITKGSLYLAYTTELEGKTVQHQNFFCVQCIAEYLQKLAEEGNFGTLELIRYFRDKTEEDIKAEEELQRQIEAGKQMQGAPEAPPIASLGPVENNNE